MGECGLRVGDPVTIVSTGEAGTVTAVSGGAPVRVTVRVGGGLDRTFVRLAAWEVAARVTVTWRI